MNEETTRCECAVSVRDLAGRGLLVDYARTASEQERRRLRIEVYEIVHPVVFRQFTRKHEIKRGHRWCAVAVDRLEDPCLDRFQDDMDAVLDDVFRHAGVPIHNLEGWVSRRVAVATIEGYRRRRGERGALQRPRIPRWLAVGLGEEPRLLALAVDVLDFVGNDVAVSSGVWPLAAWAERRALGESQRAVARDVEIVLAAMRVRPKWYESYVERPLGAKRPPVVAPTEEFVPPLGVAADQGDWVLVELASLAVTRIEQRLARGEDPGLAAAVAEIAERHQAALVGAGAGALDIGPEDGPKEGASPEPRMKS